MPVLTSDKTETTEWKPLKSWSTEVNKMERLSCRNSSSMFCDKHLILWERIKGHTDRARLLWNTYLETDSAFGRYDVYT